MRTSQNAWSLAKLITAATTPKMSINGKTVETGDNSGYSRNSCLSLSYF